MKKSNLEAILKGLDIIREAVVSEMDVVVEGAKDVVTEIPVAKEEKADKKAMKKKDVKKKDVVEEATTEVEEVEEVNEPTSKIEELKAMSLKDLKELAKEIGVAVRGSKEAIIGRILEAQADDTEEDVADEETVEEEVVDTNEEELEVEEDLETQLGEYTVEELAEILTGVGIEPKGKKQALIAKVVKAVDEGLLSFEDDDEEDEAEETVEETVEETEANEVDVDIDLEEILEELGMKDLKTIAKELGLKVKISDKKPKLMEMIGEVEDVNKVVQVLVDLGHVEMPVDDVEEADEEQGEEELTIEGSEERIKVVEENFEAFQESVESGETTMDEIDEFFEDFYAKNKSQLKKFKAMDDEEKATQYCWIQANLVDDDGDEVEFNQPYMVGDKPYCCGIPMKKISATNFVCEIDGEEVELD